MVRLAALLLILAGPLAAAECRLALVLALDVSSSVDAREDALQRGGLATALLSPQVAAAAFASPLPVAIAVYEWSGRYNQTVLADWQLVRNRGDLLEIAEAIGRSTRSETEFPTAMGYALGYGAGLFQRGPDCLFRTLDMAGDGENNDGFGPQLAYREFPFFDVVVNGLVVNGADFEAEVTLIDFYRDEVLHGPGAFLEIAQGFEDYERAMIRKLVREMTPRAIGYTAPRTTPGPG